MTNYSFSTTRNSLCTLNPLLAFASADINTDASKDAESMSPKANENEKSI